MRAVNLNSTYGVIIHRNFTPLSVDDNYARMFGFESAADLLDRIDSLLELIAPEERELARQSNQNLMTGKVEATTRTHTNLNQHGEPFTVLTLDQLIDWEGEPALKVTVVDLTMIEKANQKIRENERQFRELITKSAQGIMIQRDFQPLMVNQAWVNLYRAESIEAVMAAGSIMERIPADFRQLAQTRYQQLLNGEIEGGSIVVENLCFDGSRRHFNIYENRIEWDGAPAIQTVVEDVTEKVQLEKELAYKASHDQLTDLYNRDAIFDWLSSHADDLSALGCLVIDIDNFKTINDSYGHYAGDKVIKAFAHMCETEVGCHGMVGRWGGEEFLVLLPDMSLAESTKVAEKIRSGCESRGCRFGDIYIKTTVSIGVSHTELPRLGNQFTQLLNDADDKMYRAKGSGKNRVVV